MENGSCRPVPLNVSAALLPTDAAREYLGGISTSKLKQLVRIGAIRSIKIGRRRMYRVSALDEYIGSL